MVALKSEDVLDPAKETIKEAYSLRLTAPLPISTSHPNKTFRGLMNRGLWNPVLHIIQPQSMQLSTTLYRGVSSQAGI
jgi:hypothetical protein